MTGCKVELKTYQTFGSPVFCDLHLEKGLKHIRPCPLIAMILARLSEIKYVPEIKKLSCDKAKETAYLELEIHEMV